MDGECYHSNKIIYTKSTYEWLITIERVFVILCLSMLRNKDFFQSMNKHTNILTEHSLRNTEKDRKKVEICSNTMK